MTAYAAGGTAFGQYILNGSKHSFEIGGVEKFSVKPGGQLNSASMPAYASHAAAVAAGLVPGDLFALTTAPYGLCIVRAGG